MTCVPWQWGDIAGLLWAGSEDVRAITSNQGSDYLHSADQGSKALAVSWLNLAAIGTHTLPQFALLRKTTDVVN